MLTCARCQMVHGKTFAECQDQPYYTGKFGDTRKYTAAELLSDIKHGDVMLQAEYCTLRATSRLLTSVLGVGPTAT